AAAAGAAEVHHEVTGTATAAAAGRAARDVTGADGVVAAAGGAPTVAAGAVHRVGPLDPGVARLAAGHADRGQIADSRGRAAGNGGVAHVADGGRLGVRPVVLAYLGPGPRGVRRVRRVRARGGRVGLRRRSAGGRVGLRRRSAGGRVGLRRRRPT